MTKYLISTLFFGIGFGLMGFGIGSCNSRNMQVPYQQSLIKQRNSCYDIVNIETNILWEGDLDKIKEYRLTHPKPEKLVTSND